MTEAMRAAFRLFCSTPPDRVHTHHQHPRPIGSGCLPMGRTAEDTERLHQAIVDMKKRGLRNLDIAFELNVSKMTVWKHLRRWRKS